MLSQTCTLKIAKNFYTNHSGLDCFKIFDDKRNLKGLRATKLTILVTLKFCKQFSKDLKPFSELLPIAIFVSV